jgi:hypothetical protein
MMGMIHNPFLSSWGSFSLAGIQRKCEKEDFCIHLGGSRRYKATSLELNMEVAAVTSKGLGEMKKQMRPLFEEEDFQVWRQLGSSWKLLVPSQGGQRKEMETWEGSCPLGQV